MRNMSKYSTKNVDNPLIIRKTLKILFKRINLDTEVSTKNDVLTIRYELTKFTQCDSIEDEVHRKRNKTLLLNIQHYGTFLRMHCDFRRI